MVFHWSLSDSKVPQVSSTLLTILADLDNAIVWMVSTRPVIFKFSSPSTNHLVTVPSATITLSFSTGFSILLQTPGTLLLLFLLLLRVFNISVSWWSFIEVSRTLLSIPVDLSNAIVSMVSICPVISKFFFPFINLSVTGPSPFINLSVTVPRALITLGINVNFMFHIF